MDCLETCLLNEVSLNSEMPRSSCAFHEKMDGSVRSLLNKSTGANDPRSEQVGFGDNLPSHYTDSGERFSRQQ